MKKLISLVGIICCITSFSQSYKPTVTDSLKLQVISPRALTFIYARDLFSGITINNVGGGGSYHLPFNGDSTYYIGGDTILHRHPSEADPTVPSLVKSIPVSADATTNKYYFWNNGAVARKQIAYTDISGTPSLSGFEVITNKATDFTTQNNSLYPSVLAVKNFVTGQGYLTANQTITVSGDISGSGTTAITATIGAGKVTNTMLAGSIAATKLVGSDITLAESQVTNLSSDLSSKQGTITLTVTGTSGAATLIGNTLNIPQYNGSGGGVTTLSALTDVGITSVANNQLLHYNTTTSKWENFTPTYISSYTETDPTIATAIKNIPVSADATTNKYYYWNNGSIARKQIDYTELTSTPSLSGFELLSNKATSFTTLNNTLYPTTQAVSTFVTGQGYLTNTTGDARYALVSHTHGMADLTGFSITSVANNQLLHYNSTTTKWENFTPTYLTTNQTITLSGDISGSGTTAITTAIGAAKVTNAMLAGSIAASKLIGSDIVLPESQITNLTTDLAAKQGTLTLTTTGTSGAATLVGSTLNIPQYSGGATALSGLTDVTITSIANGQLLQYNSGSSKWVNVTPNYIPNTGGTSSGDIEISDYTKGIVMHTSDGLRARITLVNTAQGLALQITSF